jgi:hypothetical protein
VLRPGGWAAFALSTDPTAEPPPAPAPAGQSRRDMFRSLGGRTPAPPPRSAWVPLDALGATAVQGGLTLERIEGANTAQTLVLATKAA